MAMDRPSTYEVSPMGDTTGASEAGTDTLTPLSEAIAAVAPEPTPTAQSTAAGVDPERVRMLGVQIEALLITHGKALSPVRLGQALGLIAPEAPTEALPLPQSDNETAPAPVVVRKRSRKKPDADDPLALIRLGVEELNAQYAQTGRSFRVESVAGGYRLMTLPQHAGVIERLHGQGASNRLSKPAIETLAIIAYKQPVTRAQLEAVRGVACGEVLRSLIERRLVTIVGRAEEVGRPILYGTTRPFLEAFGLGSLKDLPQPGELGMGKPG